MTGIDPGYSAALDEICRLRAALAYEARVVESHLGLATFPKSRRPIAQQQITRMRAAASRRVPEDYAGTDSLRRQELLKAAGGTGTLTRGEWEREVATLANQTTGATR